MFKDINLWKNKIEKYRKIRLGYQEQGKKDVELNNWEHATGCMLWWGEGAKNRNSIALTNCNSEMIKFFVSFLRKYYNVKEEKFILSLQYYNQDNLTLEDMKKYWCDLLRLNKSNFRKCICRSEKYPNDNIKHPYGICRVSVHSTELVNRIWGSVQQYIGFDDPLGLEKFEKKYKKKPKVKTSPPIISKKPPKAELEKLLWEIPTTRIAKIYGVCDSAVGKWAKSYNLTKPSRGYWAKLNSKK